MAANSSDNTIRTEMESSIGKNSLTSSVVAECLSNIRPRRRRISTTLKMKVGHHWTHQRPEKPSQQRCRMYEKAISVQGSLLDKAMMPSAVDRSLSLAHYSGTGSSS